jgi:hypothetical protein
MYIRHTVLTYVHQTHCAYICTSDTLCLVHMYIRHTVLTYVHQTHCAYIFTSHRAVFICRCSTFLPKNSESLLLYHSVWPYSNFYYQNKCASKQITICVTLLILLLSPRVTLFKLLLSLRALPYSNFCYHHVLPYSNFCYHHVHYPIQTSVTTTCVTLFKLLLSPRALPY